MPIRTLLLLAAALATPGIAEAGAWSKSCQYNGGTTTGTIGTATNTNKRISYNEYGCYRFNNGDGLHFSSSTTGGATIIQVTAPSALITYDAALDADSAGASATTVVPYFCPIGVLDVSNPTFSCIATGGASGFPSLTGIEGDVSVQNASKRIGPGTWIFRITGVACPVNKTCQISVQGEESDD
jgi:hypothetical protein